MTFPPSAVTATRSFALGGGPELAAAVRFLLAALDSPPELLALGEPTHGEPAFPLLRNRIFELLAAQGFRSIAVEHDRVAALRVDAYVRGETDALDPTGVDGFSQGLGRVGANRELVTWMRAYNAGRPAAERLTFHGFDAPLEMTSAASPRTYLHHLHGYLAEWLGPDSFLHSRGDLEQLLGDDRRWNDPAAVFDAGKSIGASAEAITLRALADDLLTTLHAQAPWLMSASSPAAWRHAEVHGRAALGLLRYHRQAAEPVAAAERTSRLLGVRDALMAENLLAIRAHEQGRGPTLAYAHNRHLQRHPSTWHLAGMDLEWASAGAIVAALLGDRYAVAVGSLGASAALDLAAPAPGTFEAALGQANGECVLVARAALVSDAGDQRRTAGRGGDVGREVFAGERAAGREVFADEPAASRDEDEPAPRTRTDVTPEQGYFPLDAATLAHCDAVVHVTVGPAERPGVEAAAPTAADLAERILTLPEVACVQIAEGADMPKFTWGDRFFFVGPDRMRPFATIVGHDVPDFDEDSRVDRPGAFRLNVHIGREEFQRRFGYPPAAFADHRAEIDFARSDEILPHPVYAKQGWACILNPDARLPEVDRLLAHAHRRALDRRGVRTDSPRPV